MKFLKKVAGIEFVSLFSSTNYLYFTLAVVFSQLAFNTTYVSLLFLVYHLTSSNFAVSVLIMVLLFPQIFLSFLGGIIADHYDKRLIIVGGNILRALVLLPVFYFNNSLVLIYVVTFIISVLTQLYVPAEAPLIPRLVDREKLVTANSVFGMGFFATVLLGYVLAGPLIQMVGRAEVFLVLSLLFAIAGFFSFLLLKKESLREKEKEEKYTIKSANSAFFSQLKECYFLLKNIDDIGSAFFLLAFSQVVVLVLATVVPGYAKTILNVPAENLSLLLFAPAALGMVISALLIGSAFSKSNKDKLMNYGVFASSLVLCAFPFTSAFNGSLTLHLTILIAFIAGFANALVFVPSQAILQEKTPLGQTTKIYGLLFSLLGVLSIPPIVIAGELADVLGVGSVLMGLGIVVLMVGLIRVGFYPMRFKKNA